MIAYQIKNSTPVEMLNASDVDILSSKMALRFLERRIWIEEMFSAFKAHGINLDRLFTL